MNEHAFCQGFLSEVMEDVKKHTTPEQRKKAWAWRDGHRAADFHGPDEFYWYGRGCCLWIAKARGWSAWMSKQGVEGYKIPEN